jgi:hypothetical protein
MGSSKVWLIAAQFPRTIGCCAIPKLLEEESLIEGGEEVMEKRYVILAAAYEADVADWARSPGSLVPELVDAGWTVTEDTPDLRKWAGEIDGDTYARFAEGWGLENKPSEADLSMSGERADLASYSYTFDGLEWESAGWSAIVWMKFTVSEPVNTAPESVEEELAVVSQG